MISENQELLVKAKKYKESVKNRIAFRPKGQAGKWTAELIKTDANIRELQADINRENNKEDFKKTEAFLRDYDEKEKLAKEKKQAYDLFNEYKENSAITIPIKEKKEKPDFSKIGDKVINQNFKELENAQRDFNSAKQKASKRSPVGTGGRASNLQRARNRLNLALFDVEHENIVIDNRELRAEKEWLDTIIEELEAEIEDVQAIISKVEKDFALFEKHGLIKPKT